MSIRKCRHCNQPIPKERQLNAVYCSDSCKARYHENKSTASPAIISALAKTDTKIQSAFSKKENVIPHTKENTISQLAKQSINTKPYLSELRGIIDNDTEQNTQRSNQTPPITQEITPTFTTIKVETQAYQIAHAHLQKLKQEKNYTLEKLSKINQRLKEVVAQHGYAWQAGGALTGALLLNGTKKNKKINPWDLLLGAGVGLLAGTVARGVTNDNREAQKKAEIAQLNKWLKEWNEHLKNINVQIFITENSLSKITQYDIKMIENKPPMQLNSAISDTTSHLPVLFSNTKATTDTTKNTSNSNEAIVSTSKKIISSKHLKEQNYKALNFQGAFNELIGQPAVNFFCTVHGKPGEGKSTFCIKFANYLAKNFGTVIYISGEEGFSKTLKDKVVNNNAETDNLYFADINTFDEIKEEIQPDTFHFIFIDSLDTLKIDPTRMRELMELYQNSALITISQSTKDGKMRGSNEIAHDADIVIAVENGLAITTKNRFKERGKEYPIFETKPSQKQHKIVGFMPKNVI
jgi:hypothetical protein